MCERPRIVFLPGLEKALPYEERDLALADFKVRESQALALAPPILAHARRRGGIARLHGCIVM
jgi:hypothetical protein